MSTIETLKELITEQVLPDIEDYMDELFVLIADKHATDDDKEALEEMRELRSEFQQMLEEIEKGEIDDEEAQGIIEEIEEMMEGSDEEE
jgi:DNA invertase Pin-like site-specific DNA recombinase